MQQYERNDIHGAYEYSIITPEQLAIQFPLTNIEQQTIANFRAEIINIVHKRDPRLLVICGPCSIHDVEGTLDYANKLSALSIELKDQLYIVMRVYLEKPRTTTGWKGIISDPYMNDSNDVESGLKITRNLLVQLIRKKLPLATEVLHPNFLKYFEEFFSWSSIGARTTESQVHREIASGLYTATGFKNSTDGSFLNAINAIRASMIPHRYLGITRSGHVCLTHTTGNSNGHIILRGGIYPNYYPENVDDCEKKMLRSGLSSVIMIDCSHGNSNKEYLRQVKVVESIIEQIKNRNRSIIGLMLESNIYAGNQSVDLFCSKLRYGVSVTDACIDWKTTENLLCSLYKEIKPFLGSRIMRE